MLEWHKKFYQDAIGKGYCGSWITGETSWITHQIPGYERFIEYEADINNLIKVLSATIMCQYDASKFNGAELFDILQVHPLMVVHGQVVRNPAYIKPEAFLKQLKARGL